MAATLRVLSGMILALAVSAAGAVETPIEGGKLVLKSEPQSTPRRFLFKSGRDQSIAPTADPTVLGASLAVTGLSCVGATAPEDCVPVGSTMEIVVPAGENWRALGQPPGVRGYRYRGRDGAPAGLRRIVWKPGKLVVKAVGDDWPWAPGDGVDAVAVRFIVGSDEFCAYFGGTELASRAGLLSFRRAPAPADCLAICGNGVVEAPEECDMNGEPGFTRCGDPGDADECDLCSESYCGLGVECCDFGDCHPAPEFWVCSPCRQIGQECGNFTISGLSYPRSCCPGGECANIDVTVEAGYVGTCRPDSCTQDADCVGGGACEGGACCEEHGRFCAAGNTCCSGRTCRNYVLLSTPEPVLQALCGDPPYPCAADSDCQLLNDRCENGFCCSGFGEQCAFETGIFVDGEFVAEQVDIACCAGTSCVIQPGPTYFGLCQ